MVRRKNENIGNTIHQRSRVKERARKDVTKVKVGMEKTIGRSNEYGKGRNIKQGVGEEETVEDQAK